MLRELPRSADRSGLPCLDALTAVVNLGQLKAEIPAEQPAAFAAPQRLVQERSASGLVAQAADLPSSAARAKQAAMDGVEDREFDKPEGIVRLRGSNPTDVARASWQSP